MSDTLIIVLGETRASELTFEAFEKNLLKVFNADLALCVGNNPREDKNNNFYKKAKYLWIFEEKEDWGEALDAMAKKKGATGDWRALLHLHGILFGGVQGIGGQPGSGAIGLFFRAFLKNCLTENKVHDQYDRFILTRSDFLHEIPHLPPNFLDNHYIWIPDGEQYGGVTDRHTICSSKNFISYLSTIDAIFDEPEQLYFRMKDDKEWNIEKFLKFRLEEMGLYDLVRFYPYSMYTVRAPDGATRWSSGKLDKKRSMCIKYETEFESSRCALVAFKRHEKWDEDSINKHYSLLNRKKQLSKIFKKTKKSAKSKYITVILIIVAYLIGKYGF